MYKVCVFAGTKEGREIVEYLSKRDLKVFASVTTEYGENLIPESDNLEVSVKKLPRDEMVELFNRERFDLVIDATHPYAESITDSIIDSCNKTGLTSIRLLRESSSEYGDATYLDDKEKALLMLNEISGNILLTTGSKDLSLFSNIKDFKDRVYVRVLPSIDSINLCEKAGVLPSHIIAMQGPFTKEMNSALLKMFDIKAMLTKESGHAGGFIEKIDACKENNVKAIVIGRPKQVKGLSFNEVINYVNNKFSLKEDKLVNIIGIGPGNEKYLIEEAKERILDSEVLIGADRMLQGIKGNKVSLISPKDISEYILTNKEYTKFSVLMSGDSGFFSGTKKLLPLLKNVKVNVLPGISSLSYLSSKVGLSYDDTKFVSLHGRNISIINDIRNNKKVFTLVGGENGVNLLLKDMIDCNLTNSTIYVGENLSYSDEKITKGTPLTLINQKFSKLSSVLILNSELTFTVTSGLPDEYFIREDKVPMTKSEVRALVLSKLMLKKDSICWDVGSGTGSVTIEMARLVESGKVYAIEKNEKAYMLLKKNMLNARLNNIESVLGVAPDDLTNFPAPSHVFIGGSTGNMKDIIKVALSKNPDVRIVCTAVTLETVAELTEIVKSFKERDIISVSISYSKELGSYNLMSAQNPIYIFTMSNKGESACIH